MLTYQSTTKPWNCKRIPTCHQATFMSTIPNLHWIHISHICLSVSYSKCCTVNESPSEAMMSMSAGRRECTLMGTVFDLNNRVIDIFFSRKRLSGSYTTMKMIKCNVLFFLQFKSLTHLFNGSYCMYLMTCTFSSSQHRTSIPTRRVRDTTVRPSQRSITTVLEKNTY